MSIYGVTARIGTALFLAAFLAARAHAMEGMDMSGGNNTCPLMAGMHEMHIAAYHPSTGLFQELCTEIPETGPVSLTIDAVSTEIRDMTTEIRVIRGTGAEAGAADLAPITVAHLPAKAYPSGVTTFTVNLDEPGKYAILVTLSDGKAMQMTGTHVMTVGYGLQKWLVVPVAAGLILAAFLVVYVRGEHRKRQHAKAG